MYEYKILRAKTISEIEKLVESVLWLDGKLQGGISYNSFMHNYIQAVLVKVKVN